MKKQIIFLIFLIIPISLTAESAIAESFHFERSIDPKKAEQDRIEQALHKMAKENYRFKFFADARREKYLKNAKELSAETQRLLVTPEAHEFSTKADVDRLNQEIAREKKRSSKLLWFKGDKSGTLIEDLENLKMKLQKEQIDKILKERELKAKAKSKLEAAAKKVGMGKEGKNDNVHKNTIEI